MTLLQAKDGLREGSFLGYYPDLLSHRATSNKSMAHVSKIRDSQSLREITVRVRTRDGRI